MAETIKTVYFVRHGETDANLRGEPNFEDNPLNTTGFEQAGIVSERCVRLDFDAVVCSDLLRARQTCEAILGRSRKPVEYHDLFREIRGHHEPYPDRKHRAEKAVSFLEAHASERLLVVSHQGFIKAIVASMLFGPEMSEEEMRRFLSFTNHKNTGLTVCKKLAEDGRWKLITWNDHQHLG